MDKERDLDLYQRFFSREATFDIVVVIDVFSPNMDRNTFEIFHLGNTYPSLILANKTPVWNRIIEDNTCNWNYPIFFLHYRDDRLAIKPLKNLAEIYIFLDVLSKRDQGE